MTNGRAETLRILANAFDELEQLRCRLHDDSEHVRHAMDAARNEERAAVVEWLREAQFHVVTREEVAVVIKLRRQIEGGLHIRKGDA